MGIVRNLNADSFKWGLKKDTTYMAGNTYGKNFRITTWGESHGKAIGCVVDGCPAGLKLSAEDIQSVLDRRKSFSTENGTPEKRNEPDRVKILSGVFEGRTLGTAISLLIENSDVRSEDYYELKDVYRPGHADFTYDAKYGLRDYRGGGRASGRETAARVAGGAVALKILKSIGIEIETKIIQGGVAAPHDSVGGAVECTVKNMPRGIGEPVFDKLDAEISKGIMSIGAVKAIEFGAGVKVLRMSGSDNNDRFVLRDETRVDENADVEEIIREYNMAGRISKATNNAGGILGGISDGDEIFFRAYVKPTPSIEKEQLTVNSRGEEVKISVNGRHDVCIAYKAAAVVEAMTAITLVDLLFENMSSKMENVIKVYR